MDNAQTWTLANVMEYTGLSRKMATRLLNTKGCPTLPRVKNGPFYVRAEAFRAWYSRS